MVIGGLIIGVTLLSCLFYIRTCNINEENKARQTDAIKGEKYPDTFKTSPPEPNQIYKHETSEYKQGWIRQGITLYEKIGNKWRKFGTVEGGTKVHGEDCYIITDRDGNRDIKYKYVVELNFYTKEGDPHF